MFGACCFFIFLCRVFSAEVPSEYWYALVYLSPPVLIHFLLTIFAHDGIGSLLKRVLGSCFVSLALYFFVQVVWHAMREGYPGTASVWHLLAYIHPDVREHLLPGFPHTSAQSSQR